MLDSLSVSTVLQYAHTISFRLKISQIQRIDTVRNHLFLLHLSRNFEHSVHGSATSQSTTRSETQSVHCLTEGRRGHQNAAGREVNMMTLDEKLTMMPAKSRT